MALIPVCWENADKHKNIYGKSNGNKMGKMTTPSQREKSFWEQTEVFHRLYKKNSLWRKIECEQYLSKMEPKEFCLFWVWSSHFEYYIHDYTV